MSITGKAGSALSEDAERNATPTRITTPLLYVRGDADKRPIEPYLKGLKAAGVENLSSRVVKNSGELLPVEAPEEFVELIEEFGVGRVAGAKN